MTSSSTTSTTAANNNSGTAANQPAADHTSSSAANADDPSHNSLLNNHELSFSDIGSFSELLMDDDEEINITEFAAPQLQAVAEGDGNPAESQSEPPQFNNAPSSGSGEDEEADNNNPNNAALGSATTVSSAAAAAPSLLIIPTPNPHDVLLGRGGRNNRHTGNDMLRRQARGMAQEYAAAAKRHKPALAWQLVQTMRGLEPPGRCVKNYCGVFVLCIEV